MERIAAKLEMIDPPKTRFRTARENFKRLAWLRNDNACAMERVIVDVQTALHHARTARGAGY
jgi:hypothetical protein